MGKDKRDKNMGELYALLKNEIFSLGNNVTEHIEQADWRHLRKNGKTFTYVRLARKKLAIHLKANSAQVYDPQFVLQKGYTSYGNMKVRLDLHNEAELGYTMQLIKQVYDLN